MYACVCLWMYVWVDDLRHKSNLVILLEQWSFIVIIKLTINFEGESTIEGKLWFHI